MIILEESAMMMDMEGCICTIRAFVRGHEPGIRRLRLVLAKIFSEYRVNDPSMQAEAIKGMNLVPMEVNGAMSFMVTDGELSPSWKKPFHSRGDEGEQASQSSSKKFKSTPIHDRQ